MISIALVSLLALTACNSSKNIFDTKKQTRREQYVRDISRGSLGSSEMVTKWLAAGTFKSGDSIQVTLPFSEVGYFAASEPQARFYTFEAKEGQVLTVNCTLKTKGNATMFIDLFELKDTTWSQTEQADSTLTIVHESEQTNTYMVRIQPELLANVFYSVRLSLTPILLNPVQGASNKSIGSFYGDSRDGGRRKHEGVDIFAPKGALVVAPTDGIIQRVGFGGLGGKTVWMNDTKRAHSYYFAHLDSQIVKPGMRVKRGDPIGTVGNTGNAKNTPAHLHFGLYQRSSRDPVAYIRTMEVLVDKLSPDTLFESLVFRVKKAPAAFRKGPSTRMASIETLEQETWLKIVAQSGDWYRAITAMGVEGFVSKSSVIPAQKGKTLKLKNDLLLFSEADTTSAPIQQAPNTVELLARASDFLYVRTNDGITGWIQQPPSTNIRK